MKAAREWLKKKQGIVHTWRVPSDSKDKVYQITVSKHGNWECTCIGFQTHRTECKHIKQVKEYDGK